MKITLMTMLLMMMTMTAVVTFPSHLGGFNPNNNQGSYGNIDFGKGKPIPPPPPPPDPHLPVSLPKDEKRQELPKEEEEERKDVVRAEPPPADVTTDSASSDSLLEQILALKDKVWPQHKEAVIGGAIITVLIILAGLGICVGCCCSGGSGGRDRSGGGGTTYESTFTSTDGTSGGGGGGGRHHHPRSPYRQPRPSPRGGHGRAGGGGGGRKKGGGRRRWDVTRSPPNNSDATPSCPSCGVSQIKAQCWQSEISMRHSRHHFSNQFLRAFVSSSSSRLSSEEGVVQKAIISRLLSGVDHRHHLYWLEIVFDVKNWQGFDKTVCFVCMVITLSMKAKDEEYRRKDTLQTETVKGARDAYCCCWWWARKCVLRAFFHLNVSSQREHRKGREKLWTRWCDSRCLRLLHETGHTEHLYGRASECTSWCMASEPLHLHE